MKASHVATLALVLLVAVLSFNLSGQEANKLPRQRWEYLVVDSGQLKLKDVGDQGWELVALRSSGETPSPFDRYIFKRPMP